MQRGPYHTGSARQGWLQGKRAVPYGSQARANSCAGYVSSNKSRVMQMQPGKPFRDRAIGDYGTVRIHKFNGCIGTVYQVQRVNWSSQHIICYRSVFDIYNRYPESVSKPDIKSRYQQSISKIDIENQYLDIGYQYLDIENRNRDQD